MILTDKMLAVAFQYRETELWKKLADNDLFAFRLSDDEVGYCCVMGNNEEHFSLGFYRGQKGFASYLKAIDISATMQSPAAMADLAFALDCINCDFMQAADIDAKTKKTIRIYADSHGVKIRRTKGWPDFTRHQPGKIPGGIICEKDADDITEALRAALAVAEKLKGNDLHSLGFNGTDDYPTKEGGMLVPLLTPNPGDTYEWSMTALPAYLPDEWPAPKFKNDILANRVKKLPKGYDLQICLIQFPMPFDRDEKEMEVFPSSLLLCLRNHQVFPVLGSAEENSNLNILVQLANNISESGSKPDTVAVADDKTEALLKDFCERCGIRLSREENLPELEEAREYMYEYFKEIY